LLCINAWVNIHCFSCAILPISYSLLDIYDLKLNAYFVCTLVSVVELIYSNKTMLL